MMLPILSLRLVAGVVALNACAPARSTESAPTFAAVERQTHARVAADAGPVDGAHASEVTVQPRKGALEDKNSYPCSECHDESLANDPRERELTEAHADIKLAHGNGRMWCTTCHHDDRGQLRGLKGEPIDFDDAQILCGECHFRQQRDFFSGAHGKRVGGWDGPKTVMACTSCHDAHDPSIKPRLPWRRTPHNEPAEPIEPNGKRDADAH